MRDSLAAWRRFCANRDSLRSVDLGIITPLTGAAGAPLPHGSSHYFCSVGGVGLDAEVARRANDLPRWLRGHGGYAKNLVPAVFRFAPFPLKILTTHEARGWAHPSGPTPHLGAFPPTPP